MDKSLYYYLDMLEQLFIKNKDLALIFYKITPKIVDISYRYKRNDGMQIYYNDLLDVLDSFNIISSYPKDDVNYFFKELHKKDVMDSFLWLDMYLVFNDLEFDSVSTIIDNKFF